MKKIMMFLFVTMMLLSLSACNQNANNQSSTSNKQETTTISDELPDTTSEPEETAISDIQIKNNYTYQHNGFYLYKAIPLSNSTFKIECWYRGIVDEKYPFEHQYDVQIININDGSTDFKWIDESHTCFTITMHDKENDYYWKDPKMVAFAVEAHTEK